MAFAYERHEDRFNLPEHIQNGDISEEGKKVVSISENPIPDFPGVDVVMTHGPPKGILDKCPGGNVGCENLLKAVRRAKPRLHCFGHIHEVNGAELVSWGNRVVSSTSGNNRKVENKYPECSVGADEVDFGMETLMVNSAIMDRWGKLDNTPWLVNLGLGKAE